MNQSPLQFWFIKSKQNNKKPQDFGSGKSSSYQNGAELLDRGIFSALSRYLPKNHFSRRMNPKKCFAPSLQVPIIKRFVTIWLCKRFRGEDLHLCCLWFSENQKNNKRFDFRKHWKGNEKCPKIMV